GGRAARRGRAQAERRPGLGGLRAVNLTGFAPAKVNLFLHVGPRQADGYHPVSSLAVFANVGDRLTLMHSEKLGLTVTGPFARALEGERDNLVLRAVRALAAEAGLGR